MQASIDIADFRTFVTVVSVGSFTAAADILMTNKAHVSRVIARLEAHLGAQLLRRTTRQISLTEVGQEFYQRATDILNAIDAAKDVVAQSQGKPSGTLRIASGWELGALYVNDWLSQFMVRHPDVRAEIDYSSRVVDIIHEGVDVAIRAGALSDSGLIARKLGEIRFGLYARPDYLGHAGMPDAPEQLDRHSLIMFAPRGKPKWTLIRGQDSQRIARTPRIAVNSNVAARDIACNGLGVALLPLKDAARFVERGELRQILPDWSGTPVPIHAVYASSRYLSPKVRAFIDLAAANFG